MPTPERIAADRIRGKIGWICCTCGQDKPKGRSNGEPRQTCLQIGAWAFWCGDCWPAEAQRRGLQCYPHEDYVGGFWAGPPTKEELRFERRADGSFIPFDEQGLRAP